MNPIIYMDNAATTALAPSVLEAMTPYFTEHFGNPSSIYSLGAKAQTAVAHARDIIAGTIGAQSNEIYFTGGGTEADNWAIKAVAEAYESKGRHIITTTIEHHAVLHTCQYLEQKGFTISYIGVDENGIIKLDELEKAITPETILISVIFANNEIGTIQPIKEIGQMAKEKGVLFHTDAVQAYGQIPINVDEDNIDLLSASGHKFNGPKGVGFLYIRKGLKLRSFIHGGAQERRRRAGTENVPAIVGIGAAAERAMAMMSEKIAIETALRDRLIERIEATVPYCRLNGDRSKRLPNNVNFSFRFIEGESMLLLLNKKGICASSGSACTSGSLDPSHVLLAIGLPHEIAHGSLRLTLSEQTTNEDIDIVVDAVAKVVAAVRAMSPLYDDFIKKQNQASQ
jgi:cysteine desulfurase